MKPSDIAFYAAVATIVPVFLVAYIVGVRGTIEKLEEGYAEASRRFEERIREGVEQRDARRLSKPWVRPSSGPSFR
jgi:hypothetical protein